MSSPSRSTRPPGRRVRRARKSRVYRRRRLFALIAAVVSSPCSAASSGPPSAAAARTSRPPAAPARPPARPARTLPAPARRSGEEVKLTPSPSPTAWTGPPSSSLKLKLRKTIVSADISPKSVVSTGTGYVFAQNMMYKHTMTVYDAKTLKLVETIPDEIDAGRVPHQRTRADRPGVARRGRVHARRALHVRLAVLDVRRRLHRGPRHLLARRRHGQELRLPRPARHLEMDKVIPVGAVPKYLAVTPDQKYLLVTNWCSYSLSVIDIHKSKAGQERAARTVPARHRRLAGLQDGVRRRHGQPRHRRGRPHRLLGVVDQRGRRGPRHLCMAAQRQVPVRDAQQRGQRRQDRPRRRARSSTRSTPGPSRAAWPSPRTASRCSSSTTTRAP